MKISLKIFFFIILLLFPNVVYGEEGEQEQSLTVLPEKVLFEAHNLKPGDSQTKTLTIFNNGNSDFSYITSSKLVEGSTELYQQLELLVEDSSKTVYKGKMSQFNGLGKRTLKNGSKEDLQFSLSMPSELGNEFQGLSLLVEFTLRADGLGEEGVPVSGSVLPNTFAGIFNIIIIGAAILSLGIIIYLFSKRNDQDLTQKF